jgi:hypothetical protein
MEISIIKNFPYVANYANYAAVIGKYLQLSVEFRMIKYSLIFSQLTLYKLTG